MGNRFPTRPQNVPISLRRDLASSGVVMLRSFLAASVFAAGSAFVSLVFLCGTAPSQQKATHGPIATAVKTADEAAFTRKEDVIYGRKYGTALTLDVFAPKKDSNGAAVVF